MQIPLIYPSLTCLPRAFVEIRAILPFAFSVVNERTHSRGTASGSGPVIAVIDWINSTHRFLAGLHFDDTHVVVTSR
jgi:hypothetical protein